ncbi:MAG: T9SS type A sorting domain-containing protein, partial [Melioribacteraceae bacterium]
KGLYISKNKGVNWESFNNGIETWTIDDLVMDNENRIFILTSKLENNVWYYGIYRTEDMGKNWTKITKGIGDQPIYHIYVNKKGTLYVDNFGWLPSNEIYKSTDHGDSWKQLIGKSIVTNMIFGDNDEIYFGTFDGTTGNCNIQKSTDDGTSWSTIIIPDGLTIRQIALTKSEKLITCNYPSGIDISFDDGATWNQSNSGLPLIIFDSNLCKALLTNPKNNEVFFVYDLGVYQSEDDGVSWKPINNGMKGLVFDYLTSDYQNNFYLGGVGRLFFSSNSGISWEEKTQKLSDNSTRSAPTNIFVLPKNKLLLLDQFIYASTDHGDNWHKTGYLDANNEDNFIGAYARSNGKVIVWKYNGWCNYSEDNGNTWSFLIFYLPNSSGMSDVKFDSKNNFYTLNPGWSKGFYFSSDNGNSWTDISTQFPSGCPPQYFDLDSNDNLYGLWYISTDYPHYEMHYSEDNGKTWVKVGDNINVNYIREFFILDNGNIFVGTGEGLIRKNKDSNSWVKLSNDAIEKLILTKDNRLAALSLNDYKEFSLSIANNPITTVDKVNNSIPSDFSLGQNYPNPFNPETNIKYQLPNYSHISMKIFDILGREITTLIDENKQPGVYSLIINANNLHLSSGIYFYQMRAGNFTKTIKMIYLK